MSSKKKALGKDLSALLEDIGDNVQAVAEQDSVVHIPLTEIYTNPYQPRRTFNPDSLKGLAASIRAQGVMQPVIVRPRQGSINEYELIVGERRWRAARMAKLTHIPVLLRETDDRAMSILALIENIQREDLNPYEQAEALEVLRTQYSYTQQQLAKIVGMSRVAVANFLRLLKLEKEVRRMLQSGKLNMGHAKVLLALEDKEQVRAAEEVVTRSLNVHQTTLLVNRFQKRRRKRRLVTTDVNILSLQEEISDKLGVQVRFQHTQGGKGQMSVHYNSLDELDGVLRILRLRPAIKDKTK